MSWYNWIAYYLLGKRRLFTRREYWEQFARDLQGMKRVKLVDAREYDLLYEVAAHANALMRVLPASSTRSRTAADIRRRLETVLATYAAAERIRLAPPVGNAALHSSEEVVMEQP